MSAEQLIMMVCYSDKYIRQYKVEIYLEYHMQCLSRRPNWDSPPPPPPPASGCVPRGTKGGEAHTHAGEGVGGPTNSDDWRKSLVLCLLCMCPIASMVKKRCHYYLKTDRLVPMVPRSCH